MTLADKYWQSSVDVEKYAEVYESDWTLPDGAELDHKEKEIRTYEQVQHGTTTETYESYEQVGSHEETTYTDNGDGTFHSSTTTVPDYDYVTRTREVPNYVSEPVYDESDKEEQHRKRQNGSRAVERLVRNIRHDHRQHEADHHDRHDPPDVDGRGTR